MASDELPNLRPDRAPLGRGCALFFCVGLTGLGGCLTLAWLGWGLSWYSAALGLGSLALALGCLGFARRKAWARQCLGAGLLLVLGPLLFRGLFTRSQEGVRLTTLPGDRGARLVSTLYPESDGSLAAAGLLQAVGGLRDEEASRFHEILAQAYARTQPASVGLATPAIATYLLLQTPDDFDTIVIEPPGESRKPPTGAVIFLHGFAGNFYVYCWELAQAAADAKLLTLCPSLDGSGGWWTPRGERTFSATLEYARGLGIQRVYLAGLSNGAAGASVLGLAHQAELRGLILISGSRAESPPALPLLVVQGATDQMMPAKYAREYAGRSARARYYEVPGGHLVFLSKHERIRPVITDFLRTRERER